MQFRERIQMQGGQCVYIKWQGVKVRHAVVCAVGHQCSPVPYQISIGGKICPTCTAAKPEVAFRVRVAAQGGTCIYTKWRGVLAPHDLICIVGHPCSPMPANVQRGQGICKICVGNDPVRADKEHRARVTAQGGQCIYTNWRGARVPHDLICAAGHLCSPAPCSVKAGTGICRICSGRAWDVFYVVVDPLKHAVKFGISSGDPRPRLGVHRREGFTDVQLLRCDIPRARMIEADTRAVLREAGLVPLRGREYFDISALALILDFASSNDLLTSE